MTGTRRPSRPHRAPQRRSDDRAFAHRFDQRGITLFARIDHGGGAAAAGLALTAEQVLIFGNPEADTPLMQADPTVGYELPLRLLVWDADGQTMVGYRPSSEFADSYAVDAHAEVLARIDSGLEQLVQDSVARD